MPTIVESRDEFIERHGVNEHNPLVPLGRGLFLLPSGARLQEDDHGTLFAEPPADDVERLGLRKQYYETLAEQAEDAFTKLKSALTTPVSADHVATFQWRPGTPVWKWFGPPPSSDAAACLRFLRDRYRQYHAAIVDVDLAYSRLPSVVTQRKRLRAEMEERQRADAAVAEQRQRELDTINSINL